MALLEYRAADIMKEPVTISSSASLEEAALKIINEGIGALVVVESGKPIGIVTKRDVLWSVVYAGKDLAKTRVSEVMTKQLITVGPEASIAEIVNHMLSNNISHLPVVEDGELVGIISDRDLAELLSDLIDVAKWQKERR